MLTITSRIPITGVIRMAIGDDFFPAIMWKDADTKQDIDFTGCQAKLTALFRDGTELILGTIEGGIDIATTAGTMKFYLVKTSVPTAVKEGTFRLQVTDSQLRTSTWLKGSIYVSE